jgi:hypothetical protein
MEDATVLVGDIVDCLSCMHANKFFQTCRKWFRHPKPWMNILTGDDIQFAFGPGGDFDEDEFDSIWRVLKQQEGKIYGKSLERWREIFALHLVVSTQKKRILLILQFPCLFHN